MEIPPGLVKFGKRVQEQVTDRFVEAIVAAHDLLYPEEVREEKPAKIERREPIPGTLLVKETDENGDVEIALKFDWDSYKSWDTVHRFSVSDATYLWARVRVDAAPEDTPEQWHLVKAQLLSACAAGALTLRALPPPPPTGSHQDNDEREALLKFYGGDVFTPEDGDYLNLNPRFVYLDRDDLRRYALSVGDRPLFLMKEDRKGRMEVFDKSEIVPEDESPEKKELSAHARKRVEVRRIARELWAKDLSLTVVDIFNSPEVQSIKKENGESYTEDTVRDWIKEFNPNRRPGRRPKKK